MVQNYVWRLRRSLAGDGGAEIVTRGRGYELRIDRELVDVCRLERLVSEAARAAEAGEPANGAAREALALFRGDPLADVADEPFAVAEIRRLEELRLTAAELAIDADLAAGRHHEVVGEIDALLAENPLRERLHAQRMLALYRCGRQAEALEAYRHARRTLVEEIGVEPAPELRRLHDAILRQDPSLDVEPAAAELPRELDAAASPPLIGRDRELRRAAGALAARRGRCGRAGDARRRVRDGQDASGRGDRRRGASRGRGGPLRGRDRSARRRRWRRSPGRASRGGRRWSCSTMPTARPPWCARRCASSRRRSIALPVLVLATGQETAALARLEPDESLVLEPLDADSVRAIAGFYAPAGAERGARRDAAGHEPRRRAPGPRGRPREWARREATRRVDAVADRAAAGRGEARALEEELAGSVVELQSARERAGLVRADGDVAVAPVGLPVQGPGDVRRRGRRVLLRARAARRRAGRAPGRRTAARGRRPVGQRQVVGRSGPGCCPRSRAASCPAATAGRRR